MYKTLQKVLAMLAFIGLASTNTFAQLKQPLPKTFLWRISGNGLQQPSYLYGTMHLTDKRIFHFGDSLYEALSRAKGYAMEVDADSLSAYMTTKIFSNENRKLLKDAIDKETFKRIGSRLAKKLGKPADKITTDDIKQASNKAMRESYLKGGMSTFMDAYLYNIAKKQGKWTGGIEDLNDQKNIIEDDVDPEFLLREGSGEDMIEKMIQIYLSQDLNAIDSLFGTSYSEDFMDKLLVRRNHKMALRMDSIAHERSMFFTVGVAHLPGMEGVLELLSKRGFAVEPVFASKKIDPSKYSFSQVRTNWQENYSKDSSLAFQTPGPATAMPMGGIPLDMYMYMDLGTGTVYYAASIPVTPSLGNNKDSILNEMVQRMGQNATIVDKKKTTLNGHEAIEVFASRDEIKMRTIAFMNGQTAVLGIFGSKEKEPCYSADATYFFHSLKTTGIVAKEHSQTIVDSNFRYAIDIAGTELKDIPLPSVLGGEEMGSWNFGFRVYMDSDLKNLYMLVAKESKPGYYMPNKDAIVEEFRERMESGDKQLLYFEPYSFNGFKAAKATFKKKGDATALFRGRVVAVDNRMYAIIAYSDTKDSSKAISFLNSFRLLEIPAYTWQEHTGGNHEFTAWAPAPFAVLDSTENSDFASFDKYTTASYEVIREEFSKYKSFSADTALLNLYTRSYTHNGDSLLSSSITSNNGRILANIKVLTADGSSIKQYQLHLHADTLYSVFCNVPTRHFNDPNIDKFFSSFKPLKPAITSTSIFEDKTSKLLQDIQSTDSSVYEEASNGMYNTSFRKEHLPKLHQLLLDKKMNRGERYRSNISYRIASEIVRLNDSSTVTLLERTFNENRPDSFYAIDRAEMVALLMKMNQPYAQQKAKDILLSKPPFSGSIANIGYQLETATEADRKFIVQLLPLSKDSLWALALASTTATLLDSQYVSKQQLMAYEPFFINEANRQLGILKKADSADFQYDYYPIIRVLGSYSTAASYKAIQPFLGLKQLYAVSETAELLLKKKQPVPVTVINKLAADDAYRLSLYETLKKEKKLLLFPVKYATQKLMARSYLKVAGDDDEELGPIQLLKEKSYTYKGKKLKFYLYKVRYQNDDTDYLGIAGGFNLNPAIIDMDEQFNVSGIYGEEAFDEDTMDEQFTAYMALFEQEEEGTELPPPPPPPMKKE